MHIYILGRQPALGLGELEVLYGASRVRPVLGGSAVVDTKTIPFSRLGGSLKAAEILDVIPSDNLDMVFKAVANYLPEQLKNLPEGKLRIGVSCYGFQTDGGSIARRALGLKKAIKTAGRSVRIAESREPALSTAQVLHGKLIGALGWELLLVRDGNKTILARTTDVQDIDSYTLRDRGRPKRDARIGMLPPKLAQIIINLASSALERKENDDSQTRLLDPFCGTGVVLLEASLMGYEVYGTDLDERMVNYSKENLQWLHERLDVPVKSTLEASDATNGSWQQPVDLIASETYLGRPFTTPPPRDVLLETVGDCNLIITKFLRNIHPQLKPGTRLCLAVPAWQVKPHEFKHLPMLDSLEGLGYNRLSFEHVSNENLIYYRPAQLVARQLLVMTRK